MEDQIENQMEGQIEAKTESGHEIDLFLRFMVQEKASDLHLGSGSHPAIRVDGEINKFGEEILTDETLKRLLKEIMEDEQYKALLDGLESDFSYSLKGYGRFRVNVFFQGKGISTILRLIPEEILSMKQLGMMGDKDGQSVFERLANAPKGLVLVTGPTGSGKSTTLAAMIDHINATKKGHILTIEDPIEFVHESKNCLISQREVHRDTKSFNNALRAALREDPDVILVGELRDLETIKLALSAAETGHVVFGTLHTNSATKTIDRIIDVFPGNEQPMIRSMLSESLVGVVSQVLLKKLGGGRVAAHEIMIGTSAIKNLIREGKVAQMSSALQTGSKHGMKTMEQSLQDLVNDGIIDKLEASKKAEDPKKFA